MCEKSWKKNDKINDTMSRFKKQSKENNLNSIINCIEQIFYETMDKLQLVVNNVETIINSYLIWQRLIND